MISALRRCRRHFTAAVLAAGLALALLPATPAAAYDTPSFEVPQASQAPLPFVDRATDPSEALELWRSAGPATRQAAGAALAGGPDAMQEFLDAGQDAALAADRKQLVTELTESGTEHVRSSAAKMLATGDPAKIAAFLGGGWERAWQTDLRIAATNFLHYGVPSVQKAASTSLDTSEEAVEAFVLTGWKKIGATNDRVETTWLTGSASPSVTLGAQAALDTDDPQKLAEFLRYGQHVATSRDAEATSVAQLLEQVKADVAANPVGSAAVADRAGAAVVQARKIAADARGEDQKRLEADRALLVSEARSRQEQDGVGLLRQKPAREAFAAAAKELPTLLDGLSGADLDQKIGQARRATLDLALVEIPAVRSAAQAALLGGDDAIQSFIAAGLAEAHDAGAGEFESDRQRTFQALGTGGPNVQKAANAALNSANHADVRYFLEYGLADSRELDNSEFAYQSIGSGGAEVRAAGDVALSGSREDQVAFAATGQRAAAERDAATAAHVERIGRIVGELAGVADKAKLDAARAAEATTGEAAQSGQSNTGAESGNGAVAAPFGPVHGAPGVVVPWPPVEGPAVHEAAPVPSASQAPAVTVLPAEAEALKADGPPSNGSDGHLESSMAVKGWTIGLIVGLVLAAAAAITALLRRKVPAARKN